MVRKREAQAYLILLALLRPLQPLLEEVEGVCPEHSALLSSSHQLANLASLLEQATPQD